MFTCVHIIFITASLCLHMVTHVYLCLPLFTLAWIPTFIHVNSFFTYVYTCIPMYTYSCLPMFSRFYLSLPLFTRACLPIFPHDESCLPMFTYVYPCLLVFTYIYSCLPLFTRACLPLFTRVYLWLLMFTPVYLCLLVLTFVYYSSLVHVYIRLHMFTHSLPIFTLVYLCYPCSRGRVERRIKDLGLDRYISISEYDLDNLVRNIVVLHPQCGEKSVLSRLRSEGVRVQRQKIRDSLHRVDPRGCHESTEACFAQEAVYCPLSQLSLAFGWLS